MTVSYPDAEAIRSWRYEVHGLYAAVRAAESPQAGHALWVARRADLFATHPASPRQGSQVLRHAPYDPAFRFVLPVGAAKPTRFEARTGTDGSVPYERVGRLELPGIGNLDVWWLASYGGGFFVPLRDTTAGRTSYGGGRYLVEPVKGADLGRGEDARWVVDLNFAYNPSCVYDPAWACPLPPPGNQLDAAVPVGELLPT
jgi:uncharacterized protein